MASAVEATCEQIHSELTVAAAAPPPQGRAPRAPLQLQQLQVGVAPGMLPQRGCLEQLQSRHPLPRKPSAHALAPRDCAHERDCALNPGGGSPPPYAPLPSCLNPPPLQLVLHLVTSPFFRASTVTPRLIEHLAAFLQASVSRVTLGRAGTKAYQSRLTWTRPLLPACFARRLAVFCSRLADCLALAGVAPLISPRSVPAQPCRAWPSSRPR